MAKIMILFMAAFFAFGFFAPNVLADHQAGMMTGRPYSFISMFGTSVLNAKGEYLGRVSEFVMDSKGHAIFVVVSHGGFGGIGKKDIAVPYGSFSYDRQKGQFILDVTSDKMKMAPAFKKQDLYSEKWAEDMYRYFGQAPYWHEGKLVEKGIEPMKEPIKPKSVFGDSIGPYGLTPE